MSCLQETDLCVTKSGNKSYNLAFYQSSSTPLDITGATITFTLKRNLADTDAKITKEATITDAANGKATITLSSTDTNLDLGDYYYDIWIESDSIPAIPVQKGKLEITWKVKDD